MQIIRIHGGMTFSSQKEFEQYLQTRKVSIHNPSKWTDKLSDSFGVDMVVNPSMPCKENASYTTWKIHFDRLLPLMDDEIILLGTSLGGVFLAKWLSENTLSQKLLATILVAPPFDNSLPGEELVGGFALGKDLHRIGKQTDNLHFFFSDDDPIVPIEHMHKYKDKMPNAQYHILQNRGHFLLPNFPELFQLIESIVSK